ncbi:MAG: Holliday junction resolvase RecU [Erysipelotrichaceae bacterium]|nr:Holliday junction resolvase RecU [Erysipelotrichaceae bacterium]
MINYPDGSHVKVEKTIDYGRRGMSLEDDLNATNKYYLESDIAAVYKKPTPIQITKVDYKSRATAKITEAYFQTPSTTDYNGVYKSLYIDFEAKETQSKTSLVSSMIHPHQLAHMERVIRYGGIAFVIVRFYTINETYFVFADRIISYLKSATRKSIPRKWFVENGILIPYNYLIKVDYLKVIDQYVLEGK